MSVRQIVTGGFGSFGSPAAIILDGFIAEPASTTTDHAGDIVTPDEIRRLERAARSAREAQEASLQERRRKEARLTSLIDRAYRKVVLQEPEAAAEIAASIAEPTIAPPDLLSPAALRAALMGDMDRMDAIATRLRDWLWQQERDRLAAEAVEEDDIETLLLLIN